ncbi:MULTISPECIES: hypothetical protein [Burkholderia]|uniref:hypothetical protein n=1 Tax=Burkholderia TaxID=32008 RepID=UPI0015813C60|nr:MULTISPECIES: hypothetical protein [Burkholderia]
MQGDEVAADIFTPHLLDRFPEAFRIPELVPTPGDLEDQASHLVTFRVAAPHFAQLPIGW